MIINKPGSDGKRTIGFRAENPMFVLSRAEEDFKDGYLFKAWWKTTYAGKDNIEKRKTQLLNGSAAEKMLAEKMYVDTKWMEETESGWRNTDIHNEREFREKKWESADNLAV